MGRVRVVTGTPRLIGRAKGMCKACEKLSNILLEENRIAVGMAVVDAMIIATAIRYYAKNEITGNEHVDALHEVTESEGIDSKARASELANELADLAMNEVSREVVRQRIREIMNSGLN